jgi:GT2 family glycosyltransferase
LITITAILACHNRKELTLSSLESFFGALGSFRLHAVVYDDNSTDGTASSLLAAFPDRVTLLSGTGSAFWNSGMSTAFSHAISDGSDFFLWLNDDVLLDPDALQKLIEAHGEVENQTRHAIIVAPLRNECGPDVTYGGFQQGTGKGLPFYLMDMKAQPTRCDTFNGNCVLIPQNVAELVGTLDPHFFHNFGDLDYGLRARGLGCASWVIAGTAGVCAANERRRASEQEFYSGSMAERWAIFRDKKIVHIRSRIRFFYRHAGLGGVPYALSPLRVLLPFRGLKRKTSS